MATRVARRRALGLLFPLLVGAFGISCSNDFDTSRTIPPRGTLGEELYGVFCDRLGGQSLHEDLTGASYYNICHRPFTSTVDTSLLPSISPSAVNASGQLVPVAQQESDRTYGVNRLQTLANHRDSLIAALDATFPDIQIPVTDIGNPNPLDSCNAPSSGATGSLHTDLADLLGRFQPLYNDGTLPQSTESLGAMMNAFKANTSAQSAWAVYDARAGYRPIDINLGAVRPMIAYSTFRNFANATLPLLSYDSQPYAASAPVDANGNRIPVQGTAYSQLSQVLASAHAELTNATIDPPLGVLTTTVDPITGRNVLSRPRGDLEFLQALMYAQNPTFGGGSSQFITQRDSRGYALVPLVNGVIPSPFVDSTGDGLADVTSTGQFVTSDGSVAPSPFFALAGPSASSYDSYGRALDTNQGLYYGYIDTSHVYTASLMKDLAPLLDPNVQDNHETVMNLLAGAEVLFGTRTPNATKTYADGENVTYTAYSTSASPMLDLIYAFGNILADPSANDTLAFAQMLTSQQVPATTRLVGDAIYAKNLANADTMGRLPAKSTLWDEMIDVLIQIEQEPGLLEDLLRSLGASASLPLSTVFPAYMSNDDHISYDRSNLNGPAYDETTSAVANPSTPVDRTQPDAAWNRSEMQRFLEAINDTNGVTACNKQGAVVHAQGVTLLGTVDIPSGPANSLLAQGAMDIAYGSKTSFNECEVFKISNLAAFYLDSMVGAANLYFRDNFIRNGFQVLGQQVGEATVGLIEQSSGIGYDPNDADSYNGSDVTLPGFWDTSGSQTFRPKPGWLDRLVFFDLANDSPNPGDPNYTTNHFLADLQGTQIGTSVCPERVIPDPCAVSGSTCAGAPDISPDGNVHGLRDCPTNDWLYPRDEDATIVWEDYGFFNAMTPMITAFSIANNPTTGQPRHREDLFIQLMGILNKHWQSTQGATAEPTDCVLTLSPTTNCAQDGADTYEPLMAQIFGSDMLHALNSLVNIVSNMSIPTCAAVDATGKCTTAGTPENGITVLATATRALVDPAIATAAKLTDRQGNVTSVRNDGTTNPQVTPLYLVLETLNEIDQAFAAYAQANPNDTQRQINWRLARSQIVDQFLGVNGQNTMTQTFIDAATPNILPVILDTLRAQVAAHCPGPPSTTCTWARQTVTSNAATTVGGPTFATTLDLTEALRQNTAARTQLETMLTYMMNATSNNAALAEMLATMNDLLQVLQDDTNLVPLYQVLATAALPTSKDANGNVHRSVVDATTALLSRIAGRAYSGSTEVCANELDPDGVLALSLANLVTPMTGSNSQPSESALEVILDTIGDVNKVTPGSPAVVQPADLGNASNELSEFFLDPQRGLEQFYAIVKNGSVN